MQLCAVATGDIYCYQRNTLDPPCKIYVRLVYMENVKVSLKKMYAQQGENEYNEGTQGPAEIQHNGLKAGEYARWRGTA